MWEDLLIWVLRGFIDKGHLQLTLPSGRVETIGLTTGPVVAVALLDASLPRKLLSNPELTIGEAYMDGTMTIADNDLKGFLRLVIGSGCGARWSPMTWLVRLNKAMMRLSDWNPLPKARANVAHHYDISPELYGLFLDPNKQYTCAYFRDPGMTLEQAQTAKMAYIGRKLLLEPGMRVLDIGCGFGTLAIALAQDHGVRVVGVTLSEVQLAEAKQRAVAAGVADRVEFRLQDYRQVTGPFDRIVSIGMMEHVGKPHLGTYFRKVNDLLTPDGVALIHYIARPQMPDRNSPWFEKYIFPGSYCPTLSEVSPHLGRSGLILADLETWHGHYDPTLVGWRENFEKNVDRIRELTDERFIRMWRYYLMSAEITFSEGLLTIHQLQLTKRRAAVPKSRDYLYQAPVPAAVSSAVSSAARQGGYAGAGNFAQAERAHEFSESVDLFRSAGHLENEALKG